VLQGYAIEEGRLRLLVTPFASLDRLVWIDLLSPTEEEERAVEAALGFEVPTRDEMQEIEDSSRVYTDAGAAVMTVDLPVQVESDDPVLAPVTFILVGERLVTVRYHDPRVFRSFAVRSERLELDCSDGFSVLLSMLEVVVDRLADILEEVGREIDRVSRAVFRPPPQPKKGGGPDYQAVLRRIGRAGGLVANAGDSLVTLERVLVFLTATSAARPASKGAKVRLKALARDTHFLTEHTGSLTQKLNFLLDATLGMISIEQNTIIKIFSVAAVIFLPPTLVGTVYGMNFDVMPELHWALGYPFALGAMVLSAVVSYWVFKSRGWL
jgi:magnesium transporter